jgi:hypothetical protein
MPAGVLPLIGVSREAISPPYPTTQPITPRHKKTELDARLDALTAKAECATAWPAFSDAMDTDAWTKLSLDDQTQVRTLKLLESHVIRWLFLSCAPSHCVAHPPINAQQKLDDFCKSDCGKAFDDAVTEWRTWYVPCTCQIESDIWGWIK